MQKLMSSNPNSSYDSTSTTTDYQYEGGSRQGNGQSPSSRHERLGKDEDTTKKPMPVRNKVILNEDQERRKKKILYGSRGLTRIFESATVNNNLNRNLKEDKVKKEGEPKNEQMSIKERIIISANSKWKAIFDMLILILVGYSCITSMYYAAFSTTDDPIIIIIDQIVEFFFWLDLALNFL